MTSQANSLTCNDDGSRLRIALHPCRDDPRGGERKGGLRHISVRRSTGEPIIYSTLPMYRGVQLDNKLAEIDEVSGFSRACRR